MEENSEKILPTEKNKTKKTPQKTGKKQTK